VFGRIVSTLLRNAQLEDVHPTYLFSCALHYLVFLETIFKCCIIIQMYNSLLDRDDIQPLPGPRLNPEGTASIRAVLDGTENSYRIGLANVPAESPL